MNQIKQLLTRLRQCLPRWHKQLKERPVENNTQSILYTEEQLMARLKFFIGVCLALTLTGIVFVVLYSIIFVTQPLNAISPIDQKFFELIIPIATFLTGTLSGIMLAGGDKDAQKAALNAANKGWDRPPTPPTGGSNVPSTPSSFGSSPAFGSTASAGSFGSNSGFGAPAASTGFGAPSSFGAGWFGGAPSAAAMPQPTFTASGKKIVPEFEQPLL